MPRPTQQPDPESTTAVSRPVPLPMPSVTREVRIHTVHQVAEMLGVAVSDVLALIRRGALRAKRVGSNAVVSGEALADFMAQHDPGARFPRFTEAQPVVLAEEDGTLAFGLYERETEDGQVIVTRAGLFGRYEEALAPEQVQPVTCRVPTVHRR